LNYQDFLIPYIISNLFSLFLIILCYKRPKAGSKIFGIIFIAAGIFNIYTASTKPKVYVEVYGSTALIPLYKDFIYGTFGSNPALFVNLIATGQLVAGFLLFAKKNLFKLGVSGGIIFLLSIAPLGFGSAFPSTILMAIALFILYKKINFKEN